MPVRIQRKRTKGWRMPEGVVYVGRGTQWGNPFRVGPANSMPIKTYSRQEAIDKYRDEIMRRNGGIVGFNEFWIRRHLAGKDLACWCPLDLPCHADVLLELANAPVEGQ